ncbi:division/cell wall cluster transcriptional repressor MraZ [Sphingosinicella sp. LY1275]|uniref:division/cell wall cluster transcriptional repressor MraZ n=1 Tax=Sphingosinicella sp. LY1275 TaxID=3095379 RepID=UPI002ADEDF2A|nr:division/cell wall cluster transcriptional repressor MraZ [Sphingosinicella sp. LY1275]MEA1014031.1 division/cell wall cluster transcriptional repressor MraZ [Sphingosinicella sp. LY1275]
MLERRSDGRAVLFAPHETDPCVSAFDRLHASLLHADTERRRIADEQAGVAPAAHHARTRRLFGLGEEAEFDGRGRLMLPPMARRRSGITSQALFVGAGGSFEVWNPEAALASEDAALRDLAAFHLDTHSA